MTDELPLNLAALDRPSDGFHVPRPRPTLRLIPGREYWQGRSTSPLRECIEVVAVLTGVAVAGWFVSVSYHFFGYVYLLTVIALSLRVGRWPVLLAAIVSAVLWDFVFIPPRLSFSVVDVDDCLMFGTYFFAALIGGQLTARIRAQEREERQREQRAAALFHLSRALAAARSLDEAAAAALRQADELFIARTALLLPGKDNRLVPHPVSSLVVDDSEFAAAEVARSTGRAAGRHSHQVNSAACLHLPLVRANVIVGIFVVQLSPAITALSPQQQDLIDAFAAQIALLVEREHLRAAGEREKLLAESDRLRRTLLDSVSHELKTPLSVLRSVVEKIDTDDAARREQLTGEIRTAMRRLDHLVANLLNQTRLESGALQPQLDWCDARDLIGTARRAVGSALAGRVVTVDVDASLPLFRADAVLMEHVLANLLLNAALHTPPATPVRITASPTPDGRQVAMVVMDRGAGLPDAIQGELFKKFQRGEGARPGGLGLGLSIVKGFMLAQGGDVTVSSRAGYGTAFTLFLPSPKHGHVPGDDR